MFGRNWKLGENGTADKPMLVVLPSYEFRDHNQHRIISSTTIEIELNVLHTYIFELHKNYIQLYSIHDTNFTRNMRAAQAHRQINKHTRWSNRKRSKNVLCETKSPTEPNNMVVRYMSFERPVIGALMLSGWAHTRTTSATFRERMYLHDCNVYYEKCCSDSNTNVLRIIVKYT